MVHICQDGADGTRALLAHARPVGSSRKAVGAALAAAAVDQ
jgi:hypothetical protein